MQVVQGLKYTKTHEWVKVEGSKGLVGLTDYAQGHLGEIVFVELPQVGDELSAGSPLGVVESVKAVSDVYAPVSGTVREINEELLDNPGNINQDPYGSWLASLELSDLSQLEALLDAAEYEKLCAEED
ncbi:glycine cleavage system protein GcvH [Candidatus Formimonas warabiya]|uniref:Glycine cleavage system H protein n=1 Tax=Formimonas warabiya TaxID=1761012 RepID=A0A3G1KXA9_FORW1|nr:glycine cleavage system protein GcvH [Candidatus Formimonas warabiya]ATW27037.1 glycine cleavage system protein H [Candidatus Formimonas warabiya]